MRIRRARSSTSPRIFAITDFAVTSPSLMTQSKEGAAGRRPNLLGGAPPPALSHLFILDLNIVETSVASTVGEVLARDVRHSRVFRAADSNIRGLGFALICSSRCALGQDATPWAPRVYRVRNAPRVEQYFLVRCHLEFLVGREVVDKWRDGPRVVVHGVSAEFVRQNYDYGWPGTCPPPLGGCCDHPGLVKTRKKSTTPPWTPIKTKRAVGVSLALSGSARRLLRDRYPG